VVAERVTGFVTTAAPFGPAQPAFTTPLAHTTAFASETKATLRTVAETNNKAFIERSFVLAALVRREKSSQPHRRDGSV